MEHRAHRIFDTRLKTGPQSARTVARTLIPVRLEACLKQEETPMKRRTLGAVARKRALRIGALAMLAALALPSSALADTFTPPGKLASSVGINSTWVIVAGCFVMFMQAG